MAEHVTVEETAAPDLQETGVPQFDAKTFDVNDTDALHQLTEAQLDEVSAYQVEHPAPAPAEAAPLTEKKDEVVVPPTEPQPGEETEEEEEIPAPGTTPAPAADKKYAGKYKTTDDLTKGVSEAAKVLGLDPKVFDSQVSAAKESKDYSALEATYLSLNTAIGKRSAQPAITPGATQEAAPAATPSVTTPEVVAQVTNATLTQVVRGPLGQEFARKGMQVPQTEEAFEQLKVDNPYLAMKFEQELGRVYQENMTWAANHLKSQADVKAHNENALTSGISEIREYVKQYGLTITDEAAKVLSDAVAADINSYEDRYGVKFLRTGAVKSRYLSTDFATNIEAVIQTARQQAAIEAGKKIQEAGARAIRTVSTAAPTSREQGRNKSRKVDVNDPDQLAQLSDAEVDNMTR